jgi:hypothetical protein
MIEETDALTRADPQLLDAKLDDLIALLRTA